MGWSVGYDNNWNRDIGYGVPAACDHPKCATPIDRGLGYVCGGEPYGGEEGCGLFFCGHHLFYKNGVQVCKRCLDSKPPYKKPSEDTQEWINHKLTDPSWKQWREENKKEVERLKKV